MRRSDRLFDLVKILRDGDLHRAEDLADQLNVSVRTIYRDMDTLSASGVPVSGERGAGYMALEAVSLPPLNLTVTELEALHLGLAVVGEAADEDLQQAAASLSSKIDAVLPEETSDYRGTFGFAVDPFDEAAKGFQHMPTIRSAIRARQKIEIMYRSADDLSERTIRPLQMDYWGRLWTVTAWCELRKDFRVFRVDQIESLRALPGLFVDEPGKTLADYRAAKAKG